MFSMFSSIFDLNQSILSGAMDIIVIKQEDGSIKSTPFHVRFGTLKIVKSKEKLISIKINGEDVSLKMKLSSSGDAYFIADNNEKVIKNKDCINSLKKNSETNIKNIPEDTKLNNNISYIYKKNNKNIIENYINNKEYINNTIKNKKAYLNNIILDESYESINKIRSNSSPVPHRHTNLSKYYNFIDYAYLFEKDTIDKFFDKKELFLSNNKVNKFYYINNSRSSSKSPNKKIKKKHIVKNFINKIKEKKNKIIDNYNSKNFEEQIKYINNDEIPEEIVKNNNTSNYNFNLNLFSKNLGLRQQESITNIVNNYNIKHSEEEKKLKNKFNQISINKTNSSINIDSDINYSLDIKNTNNSDSTIITANKKKLLDTYNISINTIDHKNYDINNQIKIYDDIHHNYKVQLSLSLDKILENKIYCEDIFNSGIITEEEFIKNYYKLIDNNNLAMKINNNIYPFRAGQYIINYLFIYKKYPSLELFKKFLTKSSSGFFSSLKSKKKIEVVNIQEQNIKKLKNSKYNNSLLSLTSYKKGNFININLFIANDANKIFKTLNKHDSLILNSATDVRKSINEFNVKKENNLRKKKITNRTFIPSFNQLQLLNLKEGKNTAVFSCYSRLTGLKQLTCDIYLWNYTDKIVVSDIDGTITKSDLLGQIMPLFGRDWTHIGVCELYKSIYSSNYKIVYLTARALCQVFSTKDYLINLAQGILL